MLQRDGGIGLGHGHEVPLGPALGSDETDTAAGQSREPLAEQVALGHLLRQQELRRRRDVLTVELANERRQDLAVVGARGPIEEERLLSDQAALAHEEELHAGVGTLTHDADHVLVDLVGRDDLLALADLVERLDLVPQHGRPLELLLAGRLLHLSRQASGQRVVLALEELLHVAHRRRVALASLPSGAGCIAPVDEVLDAGTLELPVDPDRARPQWKELARQPERLPHGGGRVERAEVGGAVLVNAPSHHQAWELLVGRELQEGIVLVVPENDVVARPVLADEIRLQHQGLELVVGHDVVEVGDLAHEGVGLRIAGACLLEVRADAAPQRGGLAYVQRLALGVAVEVDPRAIGQRGELLVQRHDNILYRGRSLGPAGVLAGRAPSFPNSIIAGGSPTLRFGVPPIPSSDDL